MIAVLGIKRVLGLGVLVLLVAALAGAHYMVLLPHQEKVERELRGLKGEISTRRAEAQRLKDEFEKLDEVKFKYNELLRFGFFGDQDRVFARNQFNELQKQSNVISSRYEIKPVREEENRRLKEAGHKLLKSEIKLDVEAYDDIDIYNFVHLLNYGFPGRVAISNVDIRRIRDVTVPLLQGIGSGSSLPVVKAEIDLNWYTAVPDKVDGEGESR